jgi:hypothetical protein
VNQAGFPPRRLARAIQETLEEIQQRLPARRNRSYPRVVKRTQVGDKLIKRRHHKEVRHSSAPELVIFGTVGARNPSHL